MTQNLLRLNLTIEEANFLYVALVKHTYDVSNKQPVSIELINFMKTSLSIQDKLARHDERTIANA